MCIGLRGDCRFTHIAPVAASLPSHADDLRRCRPPPRPAGPHHPRHAGLDVPAARCAQGAQTRAAAGRRRGHLSRDRRPLAHLSARRECADPRLVPAGCYAPQTNPAVSTGARAARRSEAEPSLSSTSRIPDIRPQNRKRSPGVSVSYLFRLFRLLRLSAHDDVAGSRLERAQGLSSTPTGDSTPVVTGGGAYLPASRRVRSSSSS